MGRKLVIQKMEKGWRKENLGNLKKKYEKTDPINGAKAEGKLHARSFEPRPKRVM